MLKKFLLLFSLCFFLWSQAEEVHPYHVGSVEFNYNSKSKTFEITGKFFLDDLENALKEKYGTAVHFNDAKYRTQINDFLKTYFEEYLKLKADNKFLKVNLIGFDEEDSIGDFLFGTDGSVLKYLRYLSTLSELIVILWNVLIWLSTDVFKTE